MTNYADFKQQALEHVRNMPLPPLGDPADTWPVVLSEPEINAIHAFMSFVRSACQATKQDRYWNHYGPVMEALSDRLVKQTEGPNAEPPIRKQAAQ